MNSPRVRLIRSREQLPASFSLYPREDAFFTGGIISPGLPFSVPEYYLQLAGSAEDDPIRRQCIPTVQEAETSPWELTDPLGEEGFQPLPDLIHRYTDRVLFRVTDECALYCRHCFRRFYSGGSRGGFTPEQARNAAHYLSRHSEVRECILSGGDPLILSTDRLEHLLSTLRRARPDLLFRLATRFPAAAPQAVTDELVQLLRGFAPLFVVTQFNHPRELTEQSSRALTALADGGIPVLNQSVLLRGINDTAEVLAELFRGLTLQRVKPYYLFQADLAPGTAHFRVPLQEGFEVVAKLRRQISGIAMPVYAVDLPGGGGKIPLTESYLLETLPGEYRFRSPDGGVYSYPAE